MTGEVPAQTDDRPLRRDAQQNRQRLLDAAAEVFTEHGLEAGVEEIARVAGVGIGTLYRRFPTKDALICALVHEVMTTILGLARESTECPGGTGLENFLEAASAYQAAHQGILPRLWNVGSEHDSVDEVRRLIDAMLAEAKRNGRVRADLTSTDVTVILWSIRGVIETTHGAASGAWRRHLDLLIAGLRPAPEPLIHPPLSQHEVDAVLAEAMGGPVRSGSPSGARRPLMESPVT